jgi:orotidine-5'-phosphate decarboxylase
MILPEAERKPMDLSQRLIVALDFPTADEARALADRLAPLSPGLKLGLELFTAEGPALAREIAARGELFLDLKYHDIPNTVAHAVSRACTLGASMMNLHMSGGEEMVRAAVKARDDAGPAKLIGVTILTSLDDRDLSQSWGVPLDASALALRMAEQARDWGLDGVVASAREAAAIRKACGDDFLIVTPGIRPAGADSGDQKRVLSPSEALRQGSSHLVVGRPIRNAEDPLLAARAILDDMAAVLA